MPEKNDDIKQLFSHLGLNPGDYQELRAPAQATDPVRDTARFTSTPQTRRGGMTPATSQGSRTGTTQAPRTYTRTPATLRRAGVPISPPTAPVPTLAAPPVAGKPSPLQSFFEAVKEPISGSATGPAVVLGAASAARVTTDRLLDEIKELSVPPARSPTPADAAAPRQRWPDVPVQPSTPPKPVPPARPAAGSSMPPLLAQAAKAVSDVAPPPTVAPSGANPVAPKLKLKFGEPEQVKPDSADRERLQDVFARLVGNRDKRS